jgi:hypothetical protein
MNGPDLSFKLADERCETAPGHYFGKCWINKDIPETVQIELGRKVTEPLTLLDRTLEKLPKEARQYVGAVSLLRLCSSGPSHHAIRLERVKDFVNAIPGSERLAVASAHEHLATNGFGWVELDGDSSASTGPVAFLPATEADSEARPVKSIISARVPETLYVALRGHEQLVNFSVLRALAQTA